MTRLFDNFDQARDERSFRELYRRHTPRLFALAVRLCGSRAEAEELTQEAWVRAVERHETFDRRSRYGSWLTGILVNCFRESLRRRARRPNADPARAAEPATTPPPPTLDVERALSRLPPGYREVVILHDLNGYTHPEIAAMLDIEPGTSKSQLNRGRARLRELLTERGTP